jgi:hypothetical protein
MNPHGQQPQGRPVHHCEERFQPLPAHTSNACAPDDPDGDFGARTPNQDHRTKGRSGPHPPVQPMCPSAPRPYPSSAIGGRLSRVVGAGAGLFAVSRPPGSWRIKSAPNHMPPRQKSIPSLMATVAITVGRERIHPRPAEAGVQHQKRQQIAARFFSAGGAAAFRVHGRDHAEQIRQGVGRTWDRTSVRYSAAKTAPRV